MMQPKCLKYQFSQNKLRCILWKK